MFYLLIISVLALIVFWVGSEQNKKKLNDLELEVFKKASFQDQSWLSSVLTTMMVFGYMFRKELTWITPYPIYFILTVVLAWLFVIRLNINQSSLPRNFVKLDNILFAIHIFSFLGLFTFLDFWL